jgi:hypothetical protein
MQLDKAFAKLNLVQDFIPSGNSNRPGTPLTPTFITIHNTDNTSPGANAAAHAKYQKGQDARDRKVSWHFTVDDEAVYQSLPTNEVGWHAGSGKGNRSSIGIEVCMHAGMDEKLAYERAALLTALMARRLDIPLPSGVVQHHHWSGKNCPRVLRSDSRWQDFLDAVVASSEAISEVVAPEIVPTHDHGGPGSAEAPTGEYFVVVAKPNLRLRSGPGTDFDVVSSIPFASRVRVISRFRDWAMVDLNEDSGGDGFVHSAFLVSDS